MGFRFDLPGMEPSWGDAYEVDHYTGLLDKGSPAEDVGAFAYYATNPVLVFSDPKGPFEIRALMRYGGLGFLAAFARWLPAAMLAGGLFGWAFDFHDRREGGLVETWPKAATHDFEPQVDWTNW